MLRYAAAFFFVRGGDRHRVRLHQGRQGAGVASTRCSPTWTQQAIPLLQKAGGTLDGVNANLGNVDEITKDVADITDKIDKMANSVEGAVTTPARKAAAFSAGVQSAFSSFRRRERDDAGAGPGDPWSAADAAPRRRRARGLPAAGR